MLYIATPFVVTLPLPSRQVGRDKEAMGSTMFVATLIATIMTASFTMQSGPQTSPIISLPPSPPHDPTLPPPPQTSSLCIATASHDVKSPQ